MAVRESGPTLPVEEHVSTAGSPVELRPDVSEIPLKSQERGTSQRNHALLGPFSPHGAQAQVQIDIGDLQADEFGDPHPRGVQHLEHGLVPPVDRRIEPRGFQQPQHVLDAQDLG